MEQQQQQDRHQNHHHHQYHHQAESLEAHESTDEGTRDNTEFRDDDDDEFETLRRSIVEGLGLKRIPDPSKANVSQTEYERAHGEYLSRLQMSRAPGDRRRKRLHTFHATEVPSRVKRQAVDHHLFFPVEMPVDTMVDHANLRLLLATDLEENPVDVSIYRLTNSSRHLVRRERIKRLSGARWIELDTTETATYWHEGLDDNLGLELRLENTRGGNVLFSDPVFNVFTTSGRSYSRRRRSAPEQLMSLHKGRRTECRGDNKKCCRHEMTVIFKDIKGFEFIVQPKNFDAGYCKGRCPPRYNPAHHHALLQSLIWKEDKRKAPRPCCAPSKLAELEILYFDENDPTKLKVSSWKNMRVLECACS